MEEKKDISFVIGDADKEVKSTPRPAKKEIIIERKRCFGNEKNYISLTELKKQEDVKEVIILKPKWSEEECKEEITRELNRRGYSDYFREGHKFKCMDLVWFAVGNIHAETTAEYSQNAQWTSYHTIDEYTVGYMDHKKTLDLGESYNQADEIYCPINKKQKGLCNFGNPEDIFGIPKYTSKDILEGPFNNKIYFDAKVYEKAHADCKYASEYILDSPSGRDGKDDGVYYAPVSTYDETEIDTTLVVMPIYVFVAKLHGEHTSYVNAYTRKVISSGLLSGDETKKRRKERNKIRGKKLGYVLFNLLFFFLPFILLGLTGLFSWGKDYYFTAAKVWNATFSWVNPKWDEYIYGLVGLLAKTAAVLWTGLQLIFIALPIITAYVGSRIIYSKRTKIFDKTNAFKRFLFTLLTAGIGLGFLYLITYIVY